MDSLILEDFRCFAGRHEIPLRPLTLLVGENSSGKTSFLAAARIADLMRTRPRVPPDFNEEPFALGAFDELANYRGGRVGRANTFWLGATFRERVRRDLVTVQFVAQFTKVNGRPAIKQFRISHEDYEIVSDFSGESSQTLVKTPSTREGKSLDTVGGLDDPWMHLYFALFSLTEFSRQNGPFSASERKTLSLISSFWVHRLEETPYAAAPIRAQPKRTYEPLSDLPRPQGDHIPVVLAQLYGQAEWEILREPLEQFARASGLFEEITVKRLGKSESSPFQIQVKVGGPPRNLLDVGYGVSQVLPLLVDLLRDERPRMYLIQQPEVHLHPRAQAELGTLLASIAKTRSKQLLIETHSDYIIDRVRMEVREGMLKPEDVVILYFERHRSEVTISPIEIDENGNLVGTPPSYRSFFLEEEERFLGLADVHHH
ncbi:MAG: AAA family ATPase [Gemmataceae bacterium]|nr:AAA family ATPase [Gemmataceae bacterium]